MWHKLILPMTRNTVNAMENFVDINEARKITVEEYLDTVADPIRRNAVADMFNMAHATLESMSRQFHVTIGVPDLLVETTSKVGAEVFALGGMIIVTEGMINHCLDTHWPQAHEVLGRDAPYILGTNLVAQLGLAWVLAHEFAHVFRSHQQVEDELGKVDYVLRAFEHDADLCAAAAIYRKLQQLLSQGMTDTAIRRYTVFVLFWIIRSIPESNKGAGFHPSFSERFFQIIIKITCMVTSPSDAYDPDLKLAKTRKRGDALREAAVACELSYQTAHGAAGGNFFMEWQEYIENKGHVQIIKDWIKVSPYVEKHSGTTADMTPQQPPKARSNKGSEVKKARKQQRAARAKTKKC